MKRISAQVSIDEVVRSLDWQETIPKSYYKGMAIHLYQAGEYIVQEADEVKSLYVLLEGRAIVEPLSEQGKIAIIDYLDPMDMLGDIEYFSGANNYHDVKAITACKLLVLSLQSLKKDLEENIAFYKVFCENFARKLQKASIRQSRVLLYPVKNRLAKLLYELYLLSSNGMVQVKLNQTAEYLGITDRHLRRILVDFEKNEIMKRHRNKMHITNPQALKDLSTYR